MADFLVPIRPVGNDKWGSLAMIAETWEIVGETVGQNHDHSFADGHRVRHYTFRKSVHFKITQSMTLNIAAQGGRARAASLGPEKRSQQAKNAANSRRSGAVHYALEEAPLNLVGMTFRSFRNRSLLSPLYQTKAGEGIVVGVRRSPTQYRGIGTCCASFGTSARTT